MKTTQRPRVPERGAAFVSQLQDGDVALTLEQSKPLAMDPCVVKRDLDRTSLPIDSRETARQPSNGIRLSM